MLNTDLMDDSKPVAATARAAGPWRVAPVLVDGRPVAFEILAAAAPHPDGQTHTLVARFECVAEDPARGEANARLFMAADAMLAALRFVTDPAEDWPNHFLSPPGLKRLATARAAVSLAEDGGAAAVERIDPDRPEPAPAATEAAG